MLWMHLGGPLCISQVEKGDLEAARLLQRSRKFTSLATKSHSKGTALEMALARGHSEMIELLQMFEIIV